MDSLPAAQAEAIAEILRAVREADHWRAGVLMERFVADADTPALRALRTALSGARPGHEEPPEEGS